MRMQMPGRRRALAAGGACLTLLGGLALVLSTSRGLLAAARGHGPACQGPPCAGWQEGPLLEGEGTWYWLRSPEQERRVIASHYNRYCIRCHGVDGRGVWDIPDVPDFTNVRWQATRSDGQLARLILEGRGAVMPPFRGTLTLEECWAMARYLRTFLPGTEASRPDYGPAKQGGAGSAPPQALPKPATK